MATINEIHHADPKWKAWSVAAAIFLVLLFVFPMLAQSIFSWAILLVVGYFVLKLGLQAAIRGRSIGAKGKGRK